MARERVNCECSEECKNDWLGYTPFIHCKLIYRSNHLEIVEDTSNTKYAGLISVMDNDCNQYILIPIK